MDVQMKQVPRAAPARAAVAGATRAAGGGAAAREPAARHANAGPHAASLSALRAVVAQRVCADCEHARRAMGRAGPVQGQAPAPVQRLVLGGQGQYDTRDSAHIDGVVAELRSMDADSLRFVREMLDPMDEREAGFIKLIDYELELAGALGDIDHLNRTEGGGVYTTASVFVDGVLISRTEAQTHPVNGQRYYRRPGAGDAEERISDNDSEVGTLEDAYGDLEKYLAQVQPPQPIVRILIAGTAGPCDGCKRRIEMFRDDVLQLLPPGSYLSVESAYLNAGGPATRGEDEVQTHYGYANEATDHTAEGMQYWKYRYPLAKS